MHTRALTLAPCLVLALGAVATGCTDDVGAACARPTDCPAGQTCADGDCVPRYPDAGRPDADPDLRPSRDLTPSADTLADGRSTDGGAGCTPNNNGSVERDEIIFAVPAEVSVTVAENVAVDLAGTQSGGTTTWDLTTLPEQSTRKVAVMPVPGWATPDFAEATYASELMPDYGVLTKTSLLGVFKVTPTALQLLGAVSDKAKHTRLSYGSPLDLLRFPIAKGDTFETSTSVTGYSELYPLVTYTERYAIDVLEQGRLALIPGLTLDTLLVRVTQAVSQAFLPLPEVKTVAFIFVAECYGTVARIIAESDPGAALGKVQAKEAWRLAAP